MFLPPLRQSSSLRHSMLVSSLSTASRLKQLSLEKLATDHLMSAVSEHCPLLTFLNISHSKVTDAGLLMVAGVEAERRPRLERRCKSRTEPPPSSDGVLVRNITVWWRSVPGRGCPRISHLEAEDLSSLDWSNTGLGQQYKDFTAVPLDSGFVALLDSLPLTFLNTEVAGRAVLAWIRLNKKLNRKNRQLGLEVLVEARPTESLLLQVSSVCPRLREVQSLRPKLHSSSVQLWPSTQAGEVWFHHHRKLLCTKRYLRLWQASSKVFFTDIIPMH